MKLSVPLDDFLAHLLAHFAGLEQTPVKFRLENERRHFASLPVSAPGHHREIARDRVPRFLRRQIFGNNFDTNYFGRGYAPLTYGATLTYRY